MITYGFFNSVNGDRKYDANQMTEFYNGIVTEGVFQHIANGLEVTGAVASDNTLMANIDSGRAIIQNRWLNNTASYVVNLAAPDQVYGRIDAIVVRLDMDNRVITFEAKTGTPSSSPVAPSLTRTDTIYEICLAYATVAANTTSAPVITDKRSDSDLCGWAAVAQAASGEVETILNDLKTGYDGTVYQTPGAAVRGSDQKIYDDLFTCVNATNIIGTISAGSSWSNFSMSLTAGKTYSVVVTNFKNSNAGFRAINPDGSYMTEEQHTITGNGVYSFVARQSFIGIRASYFDGFVVEGPAMIKNDGNEYSTNQFASSAYSNYYYPLTEGKTYIMKLSNTSEDLSFAGIISGSTRENITMIMQYQNVCVFKAAKNYIGIRSLKIIVSIKEFEASDIIELSSISGLKPVGTFSSDSHSFTNTSITFTSGKTYLIFVDAIKANMPAYSTSEVKFVTDGGSYIDQINIDTIGIYRYNPHTDSTAIRSANCSGVVFEIPYLFKTGTEGEISNTIVTVKTDGTGDYTTIQDALDSITDNSEKKPYIIEVYEGTFDISETDLPYLSMKNYVTINGRGKGKTIVVNRKSSTVYNPSYAVFDPAQSPQAIKYACIKNMTLISQGGKCPVHVDTDHNHFAIGGKIILDSLKLVDENTDQMTSHSEGFGVINAGGVNAGLRAGQSLIVKNCESNGSIYAHNTANQNRNLGAYFEVTNCICDYSSVSDLLSGSPDKVLIQGSKIKNLRFASHGTQQGGTDNSKYHWNVTLIGNKIDRMIGAMVGNTTNPFALFDTYFGGNIAITSSDIHQFCYNSSGSNITRGEIVEIAEYEGSTHLGSLIKKYNNGRTYGVALENIDDGKTGVVQTSGVIECPIGENVSIGDGLKYNGTSFVKTTEYPELIALQSASANNNIFARFVDVV